jgi:hypothetical protein
LSSDLSEAALSAPTGGLWAFLKRNLPAIVSLIFLGGAILYLASRKDQVSAVFVAWHRIDTPDLVGAIGLMILAQFTVAWRCRVILEADGVPEPTLFWSNLRIQMVALFAAHGAVVPGFADIAKATMLKLRFEISVARSVKLVVYERVCALSGYMMVGLLATPSLVFLQVPSLLVIVPLLLWLAGFVTLAVILVLANHHISTGHTKIDWFVSSFLQVGRLYYRRRAFIELFLSAFA